MTRDKQYRIRLDDEEFEIWHGAARALKMSLSHLIRLAMREYLARILMGVDEDETIL